MATLTETRKRFSTIAIVLGVVSMGALLYLLLPLRTSVSDRYGELSLARTELKNAERQVLPLRGLPTKLVKSQHDIRAFYHERLPARYSVISDELGKLASRSGITLADVHYETPQETDVPDLELITMSSSVSGDYTRVMKFINGLERNKIFFLIDGLSLADQNAGTVKLDLHLETYLRLTEEPNLSPAGHGESKKQSRTGD